MTSATNTNLLVAIKHIWCMTGGFIIEFISCLPDPVHISSFTFLSTAEILGVKHLTVGKIFLSATILRSTALERAFFYGTETLDLFNSSLLFGDFLKSLVLDCKENIIILPETPTSFLDSTALSSLTLVLGTI